MILEPSVIESLYART